LSLGKMILMKDEVNAPITFFQKKKTFGKNGFKATVWKNPNLKKRKKVYSGNDQYIKSVLKC